MQGHLAPAKAYNSGITTIVDFLSKNTGAYLLGLNYADWLAMNKHPATFWVKFALGSIPIRKWHSKP